MRRSFVVLIVLSIFQRVRAQEEQRPEFPGGLRAFSAYVSKNLKYPEVARLIGINGRLNVLFSIDKDGRVAEVTPINCLGAGCESEAIRLLKNSPKWKPGTLYGQRVKVQYSLPIVFSMGRTNVKTNIGKLEKSPYGFVFSIKGHLYNIAEAKRILGDVFPSDQVEYAEPFYNYNKVQKFDMPDKKVVYLIIIRPS